MLHQKMHHMHKNTFFDYPPCCTCPSEGTRPTQAACCSSGRKAADGPLIGGIVFPKDVRNADLPLDECQRTKLQLHVQQENATPFETVGCSISRFGPKPTTNPPKPFLNTIKPTQTQPNPPKTFWVQVLWNCCKLSRLARY